jgi:hypothetical protein
MLFKSAFMLLLQGRFLRYCGYFFGKRIWILNILLHLDLSEKAEDGISSKFKIFRFLTIGVVNGF